MRQRLVALLLALLALLAVAATAAAQDPGPAVADLRDHDVTFEDGAITDRDLDELDRVTADLERPDAYVKVVVLASPVSDEPSLRRYAEKVLAGLGGAGRVVVFDPQAVGVASNVDDTAEVQAAEEDAAAAASRTNSLGEGVQAAVAALGTAAQQAATTSAASAPGATSDGGGGGGWVLVALLVILAAVAVGVVLLVRRSRRATARQEQVVLDEGEQKVRERVDRAATLLLELSDTATAPDAPPAAAALYAEASTGFVRVHDRLEEADTRPELEALWPDVVHVAWQLESAQATLAGTAAPAEPEAGRLFPAPPPATVPGPPGAPGQAGAAPAPRPPQGGGYRSLPQSPWLTGAAMAALEMLLEQGVGGGSRTPSRRPPMIDLGGGVLRPSQPSGGVTRRGTARSRPRIDIGPSGGSSSGSSGGGSSPASRSGRGMGRRR